MFFFLSSFFFNFDNSSHKNYRVNGRHIARGHEKYAIAVYSVRCAQFRVIFIIRTRAILASFPLRFASVLSIITRNFHFLRTSRCCIARTYLASRLRKFQTAIKLRDRGESLATSEIEYISRSIPAFAGMWRFFSNKTLGSRSSGSFISYGDRSPARGWISA